MITIEAPIGGGKSELTRMLSTVLGSEPLYEPIADNELLEKFYADKRKYGFVFQVAMVSKRFDIIKRGLTQGNAVLDRSIYGDRIFVDLLVQRGEMDKVEADAYYALVGTMLEELEYLPSKTPDLMIYIDLPLDLELAHIATRGRTFEQIDADPDLMNYYREHNKAYRSWFGNFDLCPSLTLEGEKYDFVNNPADREAVLSKIVGKLLSLDALTIDEAVAAMEKIHPSTKPEALDRLIRYV